MCSSIRIVIVHALADGRVHIVQSLNQAVTLNKAMGRGYETLGAS